LLLIEDPLIIYKMKGTTYNLKTKTSLLAVLFLLTIPPIHGSAVFTNKIISQQDDHVIVVRNNSVIFDFFPTEKIVESPVSIRVIEQPKFGELTLNDDQSFEYAPLQNLCEKDDLIIYEMKSGENIIEVTVFIEILCESLTIMSGLGKAKTSEESKVETFKILGVENFPNNFLYIFDDTGHQVFEQQSYDNEWTGLLEDSRQMDANQLYYYVFNDGGGNFYSGYLQIN